MIRHPASDPAPGPDAPAKSRIARVEDGMVIAALLLLALIPTAQVIVRLLFDVSLTAINDYVRHLAVWVACLSGIVATRERHHLSLSAGLPKLPAPYDRWAAVGAAAITVAVTTAVAVSAASLTLIGWDPYARVGVLPRRAVLAIMPIGFGLMALRAVFAGRPVEDGRSGRAGIAAGVLGIALGLVLALPSLVNVIIAVSWEIGSGLPALEIPLLDAADAVTGAVRSLRLPLLIVMIVSAVAGVPIFAVLGGIALVMFATNGVLETVPDEAYGMLIGVHVPALPLFAVTGFLLSESGAGQRLIDLCTVLFSRFRGGLIIASTLICAYFTTFTGASGVTILAVGGLLAALLVQSGFRKDLAIGLLTASGSIGLLFPPSLPIIMYGMVTQTDIRALFAGGIGPGVLMVAALIVFTLVRARRMARRSAAPRGAAPAGAAYGAAAPKAPAGLREIGGALRRAGWEAALPVIILVLLFGGITNLVETAAVAVVYLLVVQMFIHRDLRPRDLPRLFAKAAPIIGGILIILGLAKALSFAIVDAQVPQALVQWFADRVRSPYAFLILLNLALLIAGCLMDIFSATVVLAPLLIPIGESYGLDAVHLGIIFLANLELGYLTPPVGLNLFLASYRFETPLSGLYRSTLPFLAILLASVLVITYVPPLTTTLVRLLGL